MVEIFVPIDQVLCNYLTNLPLFPPVDAELAGLHRFFISFYQAFRPAAAARGIVEADQPKVLERLQKTLWFFGRSGECDEDAREAFLLAKPPALAEALKFPRAEAALALLGDLGAPVELFNDGAWRAVGRLKTCSASRLRFCADPGLARALQSLARQIQAGTSKEKAAFERFLRVDPHAILAGEKPAFALPVDAPGILANLPGPAARGWQELAAFLAGFGDYQPGVEFRSIQHGMWVVNYNSRRGGKDLCGLIVQNGEMTVRIILYDQTHFTVKDHLEELGEPVMSAFHQAHYYEEFEHQWLFIPCKQVDDTAAIKKLLLIEAEALKRKKK